MKIPASAVLALVTFSAPAALAAHPAMDPTVFGQMTSSAAARMMGAQEQATPAKPLSGKIVQTMDSGGYTYMLIESQGERRWAAVQQTPVKTGEKVTLKPGVTMVNFPSKSLNRTFDRILFSDGIEKRTGAKAVSSTQSAGSAGVDIPFSKTVVAKAKGPGAYRIADLYANAARLNGKKVTVRGKVVKVSSSIMDRNWIHIQDGSGSPQKKDQRLVVTSQGLPDVGEVVTVTGTLVQNRDFGSGYRYDVIVEKATIVREAAER